MYSTGTWGSQAQERSKQRLPHLKTLMKSYNQKLRFSVLELMGNKCVTCGFNDWRALQIDHINGGGSKVRDGQGLYRNLLQLETPELNNKYQLLCANCNFIKRYSNNELNQYSRKEI